MPKTNLLGDMKDMDPMVRSMWLSGLSAHPSKLTPIERSRTLQIVRELAELRTAPPGTLHPTLGASFQEPTSNIPLPSLPSHLDTPQRRMHDAMHEIILSRVGEVAMYQFMIDDILRKNEEWKPFELLVMLNSISEHLTGSPTYLMLEEYVFTKSKEEQAAQLADLRQRKPKIHTMIMRHIITASRIGQPAHAKGCTCPLCAYMASYLMTSSAR